MRTDRRRSRCTSAVTTIAVAALGLGAGVAPASAAPSDALPDLAMYKMSDFRIEKTPDRRRLLRYTTIIVNNGAGNFQAEGTRASGAEPEMSVVQRIFDFSGGSRMQPTAARMYWSGDGHSHWHLRDLETSSLDRADGGVKVGSAAKHGFCFFDNIKFNLLLPGSPPNASYTGCGTDPTVLTQSMGLSIGWGDAYYYNLVDQWVDITGLVPGRYRLTTTADEQDWFVESDEYNNFTWTELQINKNGPPRVTAQGPYATLPTV
jgi:Lysyl oxidase